MGIYFIDKFLHAYLKIKHIDIPSNLHYYTVLMSSCGVAVLNEMLELFVDKVLLDPYKRIYPGYDTVEDITLQVLGSIIGLLIIIAIKHKQATAK